jgi:PPOX class probable FMN-dependent enzyme
VARRIIRDEEELRRIIGRPKAVVEAKLAGRLNELTRQFVERSPFVCVATAAPDAGLDVSPRGDPPGFVRVLDDETLLLPERPGNRLADTMGNLLHDPRIALLFLIPGVSDTFRVNGLAQIVEDPELLTPSAVEGKVPRLGILVTVREAYTQCAKAILRSELWDPERHISRDELPRNGEILRRISLPDLDVEEHESERAARYARREGMY